MTGFKHRRFIQCITLLLLCFTLSPLAAWQTDFGGMPYYTGTVLPTPQQVQYHDRYLPLDNVAVVLGDGLDAHDPRLAVLRHRIDEMGGRVTVVPDLLAASSYSGVIVLGHIAEGPAAPTPPRQAEGYVMTVFDLDGLDGLRLVGSDDIGLLWAVASLNQLVTVRDGVTVVRMADIYDYPIHTLRGYISGWGADAVEDELWYIVNFKMDNVVFRRFQRRGGAWREPQAEAVYAAISRTGELLSPLGIRWYDGFRVVERNPDTQLNVAAGEDLDIVVGIAEKILRVGGNFMVNFDDHRFPIHPADQKRFTTAREADFYFLSQLTDRLSAVRPDYRLLVCPPFYYGPHPFNAYDESREAYLERLSALPDTVDVFWTGPQVKGEYKTAEQVAWVTDLIGRKPTVWQNRGWAPHIVNFHYHTDPVTAWIDWHYDGFFDEVAAYLPNTHMPDSAAAVLTLIDYLWNPHAYDAERSAREVAMKLTGPESYPLMQELNERLTVFDPYDRRMTPAAVRDLEYLEEQLAKLLEVWNQVEERFGERVHRWTRMQRYPPMQQQFVTRLRERPSLELFAEMEEAAIANAAADGIAIQEGRDTFLSAQDFGGAKGPAFYEYRDLIPRRPAVWIHGALGSYASIQASFELDPFPVESNYSLILSAQDNDRGDVARIRIRINDTVIFEGENEFGRHGWYVREYPIPVAALDRRYSRLIIESLEETSNSHGPPWFMVNYAVLRQQ